MAFPEMDVPVTLTGEEWMVVLCRLINRPLSEKGEFVYHGAMEKLQIQLFAASEANPSVDKKPADWEGR